MLNYSIGMQWLTWLWRLAWIGGLVWQAGLPAGRIFRGSTPLELQSTPPAPVAITAPLPGAVLQGKIAILFGADLSGFQYVELAFAYADDPTGTWFMLYESSQPAPAGTTVEWDTGAISDGNYILRLRVTGSDGNESVYKVAGLRVRNYSAVETDTPTPPPTATPAPTDTLSPVVTQPSPGAETLQPTLTADGTPSPSEGAASAQVSQNTQPATPVPPTAGAGQTPAGVDARNPATLDPMQVGWSIARGGLAAAGFFTLMGIYASLKRIGRRR